MKYLNITNIAEIVRLPQDQRSLKQCRFIFWAQVNPISKRKQPSGHYLSSFKITLPEIVMSK